jgi:hypothetical protein
LHGGGQCLLGGAKHGGDIDGGSAVRLMMFLLRLTAGKAGMSPGRCDRRRNISRGIYLIDHHATASGKAMVRS